MTDPIRRSHFFELRRESNETFISRFVSRSEKFLAKWVSWRKNHEKHGGKPGFFLKLTSGGLWSNKLSNRPTPASWLWVTIRLAILEAATFLVAFTILFMGPTMLSPSHIVNISISL